MEDTEEFKQKAISWAEDDYEPPLAYNVHFKEGNALLDRTALQESNLYSDFAFKEFDPKVFWVDATKPWREQARKPTVSYQCRNDIDPSWFTFDVELEENLIKISLSRTHPRHENWRSFHWLGRAKEGDKIIFKMSPDKANQIRHAIVNFTCFRSLLGDMKFSEQFPTYTGEYRKYTPDYIAKTDTDVLVLDATTTGRDDAIGLRHAFEEKLLYRTMIDHIKRTLNDNRRFSVVPVAVSRTTVLTSASLTQDFVDELCLGFRIGERIYDELLSKKLISARSEEMESRHKAIDAAFRLAAIFSKTYIPENTDHLHLDKKFVMKVMAQVEDNAFHERAVTKYWQFAETEFQQMLHEDQLEVAEKEVEKLKERFSKVSGNLGLRNTTEKGSDLKDKVQKKKAISHMPVFLFDDVYRTTSINTREFQDVTTVLTDLMVRLRSHISQGTVLGELWYKAVDSTNEIAVLSNFVSVVQPRHEKAEGMEWKKDYAKLRNKRNRVTVTQFEDTKWQELAMHGLQAKRYKNERFMKDRYAEQKRVFDLDEDTRDISDLVRSGFFPEFFQGHGGEQLWQNSDAVSYKELDISMKSILGDSCLDLTEKIMSWFLKTKISNYLFIQHRIVEELNYSLSQSCSKNKFILKQIDDLPVFLLIKPTTVDSHIFYSILIDKRGFKSFKSFPQFFHSPAVEDEEFCIYEFVSTSRHKISHFIGGVYRLIPIWMCWLDVQRIDYEKLHKLYNNPSPTPAEIETKCSISLSTVIFWESGGKTSADLSLLRYFYMELCKVSYLTPNPLKVLRKVADTIRSRLHIWVVQEMIHLGKKMIRIKPSPKIMKATEKSEYENFTEDEGGREEVDIDTDDDESDDSSESSDPEEAVYLASNLIDPVIDVNISGSALTYTGLLSFASGEETALFEQVLNLSYLSHIHNKDETSNQADFQIIRKTLKEELKAYKMTEAEIKAEWSEEVSDDYENHSYSAIEMVNLSYTGARYLQNKHGPHWKERMERELYTELGRRTLEDYATLKSSAVKSSSPNLDYQTALRELDLAAKKATGTRRKCLEAILEVAKTCELEVCPFLNIITLLKVAVSSGGVYASLFKKTQIGGTREIFILTIVDRLLINVVETISRVFCRELDPEMLTKPSVKLMRSTGHFAAISQSLKESSKEVITTTDSGDGSTWCQRFLPKQFLCQYKELVNEDILWVIAAILQLHSNKMMELSPNLIKAFIKNPNQQSMDDAMNTLKREFMEIDDGDKFLTSQFRALISCVSGFWQGILHFTGSLTHALFKLRMRYTTTSIVRSVFSKHIDLNRVEVVRSDKVSSDDMSTLKSIILDLSGLKSVKFRNNVKVDDKTTLLAVRRMLRTLAAFTLTKIGIMESKLCKLLTILESEEKSTRGALNYLEEFNSVWLLMDTVLMPRIKFHYSASMINPISSFYNRISTLFDARKQLVENGTSLLAASVVGECQRALHYITMGSTGNRFLFREYLMNLKQKPCISLGLFPIEPERAAGIFGLDFVHYLLCKHWDMYSKVERTNFQKNDIEFNENGLSAVKTFLLLGQAQRYYTVLERVNSEYSIQEKRQLLESNPEFLFRRSKSREESIAKIVVKLSQPSCVDAFSFLSPNKLYASSAYSLSQPVVSKRFYKEDGTVDKSKQSLIGLMRDQAVSELPLNSQELMILFPSLGFYDDLYNYYLDTIAPARIQHSIVKLTNRFVSMSLPKASAYAPLTLSYCAKRKWFPGTEKRHPEEIFNYSWLVYKSVFTWLRDDITETLAESPFTTYKSLAEFISSMEPSMRSFKVLTKGAPKEGVMETVKSVLKNSFCHYAKLTTIQASSKIENLETILQDARRRCCMILDSPIFSEGKVHAVNQILKKAGEDSLILEKIQKSMIFNLSKPLRNVAILCAFAVWNWSDQPEQQEFIYTGDGDQKVKRYFTDILNQAKSHLEVEFIKRQEYNKETRLWEGEGIFTTSIDKLIYRIKIKDEHVLGIECPDIDRFSVDKQLILNILKEMDLTAPTMGMKARHNHKFFCRIDGTMSAGGHNSFYVSVDEDLRHIKPFIRHAVYEMALSGPVLRLRRRSTRSEALHGRSHTWITVARTTFPAKRIESETEFDLKLMLDKLEYLEGSNFQSFILSVTCKYYREYCYSLLNNETMDLELMLYFMRDLNKLSTLDPSDSLATEEYKDWYDDQFDVVRSLTSSGWAFWMDLADKQDFDPQFRDIWSSLNEPKKKKNKIGMEDVADVEDRLYHYVEEGFRLLQSDMKRMRLQIREWFISRLDFLSKSPGGLSIKGIDNVRLREVGLREESETGSRSSYASYHQVIGGFKIVRDKESSPPAEASSVPNISFKEFLGVSPDFDQLEVFNLDVKSGFENMEMVAELPVDLIMDLLDELSTKVMRGRDFTGGPILMARTGIKYNHPLFDDLIESIKTHPRRTFLEILIQEFMWSQGKPDEIQIDAFLESSGSRDDELEGLKTLAMSLKVIFCLDYREIVLSGVLQRIIDEIREKKPRIPKIRGM